MTRRVTVNLDDDLYALLLQRAGSERKISETLNPILRDCLLPNALPELLERVEKMERELAELRAAITSVVKLQR